MTSAKSKLLWLSEPWACGVVFAIILLISVPFDKYLSAAILGGGMTQVASLMFAILTALIGLLASRWWQIPAFCLLASFAYRLVEVRPLEPRTTGMEAFWIVAGFIVSVLVASAINGVKALVFMRKK